MNNSKSSTPRVIRVSLGSAILLGLIRGFMDAKPTTIYLLTYREEKCSANCAFCPQARTSKGRADMLSRVTWPPFKIDDVIEGIGEAFRDGLIRRVCLQTLNYPNVFEDIMFIVKMIKSCVNVPLSVSCQPLNREMIMKLHEAGVERVSIALDASTPTLFDKVKGREVGGPYTWDGHIRALREAVKIFGRGMVTTHLIVGLGEDEEDVVRMIQTCIDMGVYPALFAFTPIEGTLMADHPRPSLTSYRRIQLAHYLITHSISRYESMKFKDGRLISFGLPKDQLIEVVESGEPFMTTGCPGCNRPYYNERPAGPIYNYPRRLRFEEIVEIKEELGLS